MIPVSARLCAVCDLSSLRLFGLCVTKVIWGYGPSRSSDLRWWLGHSSPSFLVQSPRSRALDRCAVFLSFTTLLYSKMKKSRSSSVRLYFLASISDVVEPLIMGISFLSFLSLALNRRPAIVLAGSTYFYFFCFKPTGRINRVVTRREPNSPTTETNKKTKKTKKKKWLTRKCFDSSKE